MLSVDRPQMRQQMTLDTRRLASGVVPGSLIRSIMHLGPAGAIEPRPDLYEACKDLVAEAHMVGDVSGLGLIDKAIREANAVVYGLG